jgi:hypothetical protein
MGNLDDKETETDDYGEYDVDAGSTHPVDPDHYIPCNAVLRHTWSRYDERRYCTAMAVENFKPEEGSQFCRQHKGRENLMELHEDNFKTGATVQNKDRIFKLMEVPKKVLANDMYRSLLGESKYDFETEMTELNIDIEDTDVGGEADTLIVDHPVPTEKRVRAKALWFAALDFMVMENIREEQFKTAIDENVAVGERMKTITVTEQGREIEDVDEHHLNLALSRIQSDYSDHVAFGGVTIEGEEQSSTMSEREWVIEVHNDDDGPDAMSEYDGKAEPGIVDVETPDVNEDS